MPTVYATAADVEADLGSELYTHLADRDADGNADTAAVTSILANVASQIDGYVSRHLVGGSLPVVPAWLTQVAIDITVYRLSESPTEKQLQAYKDALQHLRDVASGKLQLGVTHSEAQLDDDVEVIACDQVFSRANAAGIL